MGSLKFFSGVFRLKILSFRMNRSTLGKSPEEMSTRASLLDSHDIINTKIANDGRDKDTVVIEYLKNVKYPPIGDFTPGLEWFNVTEPLSFTKHLHGKVVLLDFFTYCCINCMHVLPELKEIEEEFTVKDGLVVIGVHSAKFENECNSKNILSAVQRYNISHPVVNDRDMNIWEKCDVHCWPTLLLLGPRANPLVMVMGEGHKEDLKLYIKNALMYYKSMGEISEHLLPVKSAQHLLSQIKGPLLFPGKVANFVDRSGNETLAISDSGNHRILIMNTDGIVKCTVGGIKSGFADGSFTVARFNSPQGIAFYDSNTIYVADTENHLIRKINLSGGTVETVAGTGKQGNDKKGGPDGKSIELSSPWDVCMYRYTESDNSVKDVLLIAMAGTHQIWALFLEDTMWWKSNKVAAGSCIAIAGNGREENRNNQYPHAASFAQPSGLALAQRNEEVFIADSESSSIRTLSLKSGMVTAVVGGDRNPLNLFAFGDRDGKSYDAKLQHPLGVALSKDENVLFVADTYNHKIKRIEIGRSAASTISTITGYTESFNEPAGLCVGENGKLYVADTNNHCIKTLILHCDTCNSMKEVQITIKEEVDQGRYRTLEGGVSTICLEGGIIHLEVSFELRNGLKLTEGAVQRWECHLPEESWFCEPRKGDELNVLGVKSRVKVPQVAKSRRDFIDISFSLMTCSETVCFSNLFVLRHCVERTGIHINEGESVLYTVILDGEHVELARN